MSVGRVVQLGAGVPPVVVCSATPNEWLIHGFQPSGAHKMPKTAPNCPKGQWTALKWTDHCRNFVMWGISSIVVDPVDDDLVLA